MRDYVFIPEKLYDDIELLTNLSDDGYKYVMSFEPKPKKKK